jgi:hypothetical protein
MYEGYPGKRSWFSPVPPENAGSVPKIAYDLFLSKHSKLITIYPFDVT